MGKALIASILAFAAVLTIGHAAPAEHLIKNLPGVDFPQNFKMYSGYIQVNETHNKNLFYWFVESQRDPANDPVVLWLQGGPGASSLYAVFDEHGPFRANKDGKTLSLYEQSWNKYANVLYVESPVFVGFSYSDNKRDYWTNDQIVAGENYEFIRRWLELFPEFRNNEFYLSGESYAGHYVPTLAHEILKRDVNKQINMRGFLVGNPLHHSDGFLSTIDVNWDEWPSLTFLYSHGLVSHDAYEAAHKACGWEGYMAACGRNFTFTDKECIAAVKRAINQPPADMDLYGIDAPACFDTNFYRHTSQWSHLAKVMEQRRAASNNGDGNFDPCVTYYIPKYLNIPEVQEAIHARSTKWSDLGKLIYGTLKDDMTPYYKEFFENERSADWRILIFSGDFDAIVPFTGTQRWIECLGRPVKKDWHSWRVNRQVAGNAIEYDKLTFVTVKGAGHMVSYYTPDKGLALFKRFVDKEGF